MDSKFVNIKVKCNFYRVKLGQTINNYKLEITRDDEVIDPNQNFELLLKVASLRRKDLIAIYGAHHQRVSNMIYSSVTVDEQKFENDIEGKRIVTEIKPAGILQMSQNSEASNLYGRIFKQMQRKLKLQQANRKYFDIKQAVRFPNWKLQIAPGYSTSIRVYRDQPLINIDLSFKTLREQTVAELFYANKSKWMEGNGKLKDVVVGLSVMTTHNKILFRIDDVDYGKKPTDGFTREDGSTITFLQYFKEKYNHDLKERDMPMLVQRKMRNGKEETVYFPPELCILTGLTPEMKENRNLMRDLAKTTKPVPGARLDKCTDLIRKLNDTKEVTDIMKEWDMRIDPEPITINAKRATAGRMIMGPNKNDRTAEFEVDDNSNLDRETQCRMFEQPELESWVIFYPQRDEKILDKFLDTMKSSIEFYSYKAKKPKIVGVRSRDAEEWIKEINNNTDQNTRMAVFLLEGRKNAAPLYDPIKTYLITQRPIPSQMVITSTANSDRGLRSICNKILVQICAKVGGVPWNISDLPFSDKPAMIIGVDVFHKTGSQKKKSLLALTATVNRHFSKYWCTVRQHEEGQEVGTYLESAFTDAVKEFYSVNNRAPVRIIVYRDGVSDNQRQAIQTMEVASFLRAIETLLADKVFTERPDFMFVCANKNVTAKFYNGEHLSNPRVPLNNPKPGSIIDSDVTEGNDFYLISQTVREGSVTPTHYFVLGCYTEINGEYKHRDETAKQLLGQIQTLTYKLCYLYYNWTGSIKIPAPIQYADRLANLIGDRWTNGHPMIPHVRFGKAKSLFFI